MLYIRSVKKYTYILFDWDGNLAKTLDIWLMAYRAAFEKQGLILSDEEVAASFGEISVYLDKWGILKEKDIVVSDADRIGKQLLPSVELYPDALLVLETLHQQGKKIALITSSSHENVNHLLQKHRLSKFFDTVITYEDTARHKPYPDPLECALKNMDGDASRAIMIGDTDKDIRAAKNAGVDSILFYPPEHAKFYNLAALKEHLPTYIVEDFREILAIVG